MKRESVHPVSLGSHRPTLATRYLNFWKFRIPVQAFELPDSYDNAEASCLSQDAHLTSIHSLTEAVFINGLYHVTHRKRHLGHIATKYIFWIGLNQTSGTWEWLDGSRLDYDILSAGYKESEDYISSQGAAASHTGIHWFRTNLTVGGFVCKKPTIDGSEERKIVNDLELGRVVRSSRWVGIYSDNDKCPFRYWWMESVQSCYRVSLSPAKYEEATHICQSDNGNLLSVHSNLENILINGLIMMIYGDNGLVESKPPFWIGLRTENRKFVWTDGSEVDFFDASRVPKLTGFNETFAVSCQTFQAFRRHLWASEALDAFWRISSQSFCFSVDFLGILEPNGTHIEKLYL